MSSFRFISFLSAWAISVVGTFTSLYWSIVLGWIPCELCWYERICMYPTFLLLSLSVLFQDRSIFRYTLPLTVIGAIVSVYHYSIQVVPLLSSSTSCQSSVPCQIPEFSIFGFITPPFFALVGFLVMTALSLLNLKQR